LEWRPFTGALPCAPIVQSPEQTTLDKSFAPTNRRPRCVEESLPSVRLPGCTTRSVSCLRASNNNHANANSAARVPASLNSYRLANRVCWSTAKPIFAAVFQNQLDGRAKAFTTLFHAAPLPVSSGNLGRPSDEPFSIALNDCSEFVAHESSIERNCNRI